MSKFNVGDTVKIVRNMNGDGRYIGFVSKIINYAEGLEFPYKLKGVYSVWCDKELELVEERKQFTKNDLKERWIVKFRSGREAMFNGERFLEIKDGKFVDNIISNLGSYKNDLTNKLEYESASAYDIVEVYKPHYDKVWERQEEQKKEMTIAEIEEELGYSIKIVKEVK